MTITTNTTDRKALAKAIAEELGTTARYMGMPSCGYKIGDFIVDRDGNIIGEDFGALREFLARHEFITDDTIQNTPGEPEVSEEPGTREEAPGCMYISVPAQDITPAQLKNLAHMLYSRQRMRFSFLCASVRRPSTAFRMSVRLSGERSPAHGSR